MLRTFQSFLKSCAWQAVIFPQAQMYLDLHISQTAWFFKVKNATSHSATFVTFIFLK